MQAFSWIILVHFYKRIKPACTRYKMPWTQTPVSDSSQKEMLTERVQEAVTYFFHFTSLSIHHWFSQKLCPSAVTLTFMNLRILLVNPLTSLCFWASAAPCGNELERDTVRAPLLDTHWGRPVPFSSCGRSRIPLLHHCCTLLYLSFLL